jgi:UDP-N-acetyl-2-amino-2-deoxyglucuronate dehydrogenase
VKKIKIALAGCGRISKNHFESFRELKDKFELTAVCDIIPERAFEATEKYGARAFTDYDNMLAEGDFEVITIATPSGIHPDL